MDQSRLNWIRDFIWNIADDYLRDVYVRGKYRDVILPMTVIRRLDAVLEPTKQAVLTMDRLLDKAGITEKCQALCKAAGQSFYNTSPFKLRELAAEHGKEVSIHLYGQEINPETYAICKADLLLKGEGQEAENIVGGADKSTLSNDAFAYREFDFMLSNPPYGKSWKTDLERMGGKADLKDPRFVISHGGDPEYKLITRSSDGQLMFLVNKLHKMKRDSPLGSRVAMVHNGSALFTGDAGQGESNIRRWILENDWLEAIIALPLNMFYNTGIATYIWVLGNRKAEARQGKVQLIDATQWFKPLRTNLGKKNCELGPDDIARIVHTLLDFEETENSKIFPNEAFGYWKITVERPLRLRSQFTRANVEALRFASGDAALRRELFNRFGNDLYDRFHIIRGEMEQILLGEDENGDEDGEESSGSKKKAIPEKRRKKLLDPGTWARDHRLHVAAKVLWKAVGDEVFMDHNAFRERFEAAAQDVAPELSAAERKLIQRAVSERDETAAPVLSGKPSKPKKDLDYARERLYGQFLVRNGEKSDVVEYEPDPELRDTEQVPLLEKGGIEGFFRREVLPYAKDAWIDPKGTKIGYEISFARYFHKPAPLRALEQIRADILALERDTEGLLQRILEDSP